MAEHPKLKRAGALAGYYLKAVLRRFHLVSWLVLFLALYLSLALVAPPLQGPLRTMGLEFPGGLDFEISGTIVEVGSRQPIPFIQVSVGGYSTTTDAGGNYDLQFASSSSQQICVVIGSGRNVSVQFVDAGPDFRIEHDRSIQLK